MDCFFGNELALLKNELDIGAMMQRKMKSRNFGMRLWRRGTAAMQAVLVLPLLLPVTFGTIEFGDYFYVKHCFQTAAHSGAMVAIVKGATYNDITNAVSASLNSARLSGSGYTLVVKDNGTTIASLSSVAAGDTLTVTVSSSWGSAGAGCRPMGIIGAAKTVAGGATMRAESGANNAITYSYSTTSADPNATSSNWNYWAGWWNTNYWNGH